MAQTDTETGSSSKKMSAAERTRQWRTKHPLTAEQKAEKYQKEKAYLKANPEKAKARKEKSKEKRPQHDRKIRLWTMFRMTPEEWDKLNFFQKGVCAISGRPPGKQRLSLDHNHRTGEVRGLLFARINRAIAMFEDNPTWLRAAADYLEHPTVEKALGKRVFGIIGRAQYKKKMLYGSENGPIKPIKKGKK